MKRKDLEKKLRAAGFVLARHGGSHDIFRRGDVEVAVPRHNEINELLAKSIIKKHCL